LDKIENQTIVARPIAPGTMASVASHKSMGYDMQTMPTQMVEFGHNSDAIYVNMSRCSSNKKISMIHEHLESEGDADIDPDSDEDN
jgi:hypothetical protein